MYPFNDQDPTQQKWMGGLTCLVKNSNMIKHC